MENNTKKVQGLRELNEKEMNAVSGAWLPALITVAAAAWELGCGIYDGYKGK